MGNKVKNLCDHSRRTYGRCEMLRSVIRKYFKKIVQWKELEVSPHLFKIYDYQQPMVGKQLIGLNDLCELHFNLKLNKGLQCSTWEKDVLSSAQIQYAATDAGILIMLVKLGIFPSENSVISAKKTNQQNQSTK